MNAGIERKTVFFSCCYWFSYKHELNTVMHPFILVGLYRDVEAADRQCNELEKVVALVENHRQRFRHIDNVSE